MPRRKKQSHLTKLIALAYLPITTQLFTLVNVFIRLATKFYNTFLVACHLVSFCLVKCHFVFFVLSHLCNHICLIYLVYPLIYLNFLILSCLVLFRYVSSGFLFFRLVLSCLVSSHIISYPSVSSCLVSFGLILSRLVSSKRTERKFRTRLVWSGDHSSVKQALLRLPLYLIWIW